MEQLMCQVSNPSMSSFEDTEKEWVIHGAVLMRGDMFMQNEFVPSKVISDAVKRVGVSLHDMNHRGTGFMLPTGQLIPPDISYFVGYQDNYVYDEAKKSLYVDIHIMKNDSKANKEWKTYYDLCQQAGRMPNLSSYGYKQVSIIRASQLGIDMAAYGIRPEQNIRCLQYINITAGSTVYQGACNDKDGCGIPLASEELPRDISCDEEYQNYLNKRIKQIGG